MNFKITKTPLTLELRDKYYYLTVNDEFIFLNDEHLKLIRALLECENTELVIESDLNCYDYDYKILTIENRAEFILKIGDDELTLSDDDIDNFKKFLQELKNE